MKRFRIKIEPEALEDIRDITDWYNEAQEGLGKRFQNTVIKQINSLKKDPQIYAIRYNEIRCVIVKKFPYMVHFYIDSEKNTVEVLAVISFARNPEIWKDKITR
jgi:plasmid stabilization system protein ParE